MTTESAVRERLARTIRQAQVEAGELRLCGDMDALYIADAIISAFPELTRPASSDAERAARDLLDMEPVNVATHGAREMNDQRGGER